MFAILYTILHILKKNKVSAVIRRLYNKKAAFLTGRPRTTSVVAIDKIRVFEFKKFLLKEIFEKTPDALRRLHDFYECRIEDTLKKITSATKKIGH